ncbi:MAG TPA: 30S ribosomal protein S17 [Patescibacteria group bacterium]|nr:30S ribosomal protein S17 [Patescibacteria group bacterium]
MKIFTGIVIATKTAKTATVSVERMIVHPLYKKRFRRSTKYLVHDELGVKTGDKVTFVASKPYSKMKKWKITEVISSKSEILNPKSETKTKVQSSKLETVKKGDAK